MRSRAVASEPNIPFDLVWVRDCPDKDGHKDRDRAETTAGSLGHGLTCFRFVPLVE